MATQTIQNEQLLPEWYTNYLTQVMGRAVGAAGEPYQPYEGQLTAGLTPDQMQAYQEVRDMQGGQTPTLKSALDLYGQAGGVDSGAAGSGSFDAATGMYSRGANTSTGNIYDPYGSQALDFTYGAGQQATPYITGSTNPIGLSAAQPYLNAAGGNLPSNISAYMNPYNSAVTDQIASLGARNLSENILPQIQDQFISSGGYGSTRQGVVSEKALRDTQEAILAEQNKALQAGYNTAGSQYEADAARQAALAGTAGGLGVQQQQITQQAGLGLGNLGLGQANSVSGIGQAGANLYGADATRQLQAGQGLSSIGQSQIQASQSDNAQRLAAALGYNNLATNAQTLGMQQAAALESAGAGVQGQQQRGLDTAYGQFQLQQQYPWQQVGNLSNVIQGLPVNTSSTSQTNTSGPSATSQAAGIGLGIAGLANSGIFKARGGAVRLAAGGKVGGGKPKSRVSYGIAPRRGLSFYGQSPGKAAA